MATLRQIEANRLNSQRSTGPRTEQGKAVSSRNNLTHGLRAATVVLPEENQEDFDAEYQELFDHFQPQGPVERHLLEQMADYRWKAVRINVILQSRIIDIRDEVNSPLWNKKPPENPRADFFKRMAWPKWSEDLEPLQIMQERFDRAYLRAERRLSQLQKERRAQEPLAQMEPQPEPLPSEAHVEPERKPPTTAAESNPATDLDPDRPAPERDPKQKTECCSRKGEAELERIADS